MTKATRTTTVLAGFAAAMLAAATGGAAWAQSKEPLKLGLVLSLSGPTSVYGIPERDAILTALEDINANGGAGGRKVEFVLFDDKSNPTEATRGVNQLISNDKVDAIIGPSSGSSILAAAPIAQRLQVPLLAPAGTIAITDKKNAFFPWVFRLAINDMTGIKMILSTAAKSGAKRIAVFYQEDAYGKTGVDFANQLSKELGYEVVETVSAPYNATDLTAQATKLRNAQPDTVFMQVSVSSLGAAYMKASRQVGLEVPTYVNSGLALKSFVDAIGPVGNGLRVLSIGNLPYEPSPGEAKLAALLQKAGKEPQGWAELIGTNGLIAAVDAAKTIEGKIDGAKMRDALEKLCGIEAYVRGKGCFSSDNHDGWGDGSLVITEVSDGKLRTRQ